MKGLEKFQSKLPSLQGRKIIVIPLLAIIGMTTGLLFQLFFDYMGRLLPDYQILVALEPFLPVIGSLLILLIAFYLVTGIWRNKDRYLNQNKETAYQKVIIPGFFGINLVFSVVIHTFIPFTTWGGSPANATTAILGSSLLQVFWGEYPSYRVVELVRKIIFFGFLFYGILGVRQILNLFGIDYMALVYTIYPEESEIRNDEIYDIIRHPSYSMIMFLAIGGGILHLSVYSILYVSLLRVYFHFHLILYEERELLERFGDSYQEYIETTPALFPKLGDIAKHMKFVLNLNSR